MGAPAVVIFDVNETLSDLTPLAARFEEAGAPSELLGTWFAATLRDGIALAASGSYADFRDVGRANLLQLLPTATAEAAEHVLDGFAALPVHPDVPHGLQVLRDARIRIATLTNGTTQIARALLERAGLEELVEQHLDVSERAPLEARAGSLPVRLRRARRRARAGRSARRAPVGRPRRAARRPPWCLA